MIKPGPRNSLTDVPGLRVGNAQDIRVRTGVTVILPDEPVVMAATVSGGAPGTRETPALDPTCLVDRFHGLVLSGGSVFGLDAAGGVTAWLSLRGMGLAIGAIPLPVVPAAILFDMTNGGEKNWGLVPPYRDLGLAACEEAGDSFAIGNAGAGYGAQAGGIKGGLGTASAVDDEGLVVAALVAVNCFGSPLMPGSRALWAAPWAQGDEFLALLGQELPIPPRKVTLEVEIPKGQRLATNTTIGAVATNAPLTKAEARRVAIMAQDGLARAIRPIHTPFDGDTLFSIAAGTWSGTASGPALVTRIGALAADCVTRAVGRGLLAADSLGEMRSYRDTV